ncbi:hypothetical protein LQE85_01640 [Stenotrophomonas rhizophila]|uniref:hypothetical protein n=1 Tax=Stenotrophomonas rhizophila TaxID=216778 RepID=UPI00201CE46C|nr:hypothetical protein [Stenotrophomonas rhizophila]UQY87967.1 hypothetical protein LQE85_01640 [Stenotrophomonas rhizophila]
MTSGHRSNGVDFDELFDPDVIGDGPAAAGFMRGGQPLRFAHIRYGAKGPDVGRRQGGVDVSNLWAARGTASYSLPINGQAYSSHNQSRTNSTGSAVATVTFILDSAGTYRVLGNTTGGGNNSGADLAAGSWLPAGASAGQYDVQFEAANVGVASISNGAPSFASCTATRSIAASVSVPAASLENQFAEVTLTIRLRRSNGAVSTTQIYAKVGAAGWY